MIKKWENGGERQKEEGESGKQERKKGGAEGEQRVKERQSKRGKTEVKEWGRERSPVSLLLWKLLWKCFIDNQQELRLNIFPEPVFNHEQMYASFFVKSAQTDVKVKGVNNDK